MITRLTRLTLAAGLALGLGALAPAARAAPASAAPILAVLPAPDASGMLQEVRYVNRCRPQRTERRDRFGRRVVVHREVCRRVWVGRGGPRDRYRY